MITILIFLILLFIVLGPRSANDNRKRATPLLVTIIAIIIMVVGNLLKQI